MRSSRDFSVTNIFHHEGREEHEGKKGNNIFWASVQNDVGFDGLLSESIGFYRFLDRCQLTIIWKIISQDLPTTKKQFLFSE